MDCNRLLLRKVLETIEIVHWFVWLRWSATVARNRLTMRLGDGLIEVNCCVRAT